MDNQELYDLTRQYLAGTISPVDRQRLQDWYQAGTAEELALRIPALDSREDEKALQRRMLRKIRATIEPQAPATARRIRLFIGRSAAAAILLLLIGGYWILHHQAGTSPIAAVGTTQKPSGTPGHDAATLTLSGGRKILLDSSMQDTVLTEGNAMVASSKGRLAYNPGSGANGKPTYNTLSTAGGGQYRLTLPDGTRAWLNAASSITYPTAFTGISRPVTITGEVYFEVAANPHQPFMVKAGPTDITVLGTHFDVNAYSDEQTIKTTLLEGAVKVHQGTVSQSLMPGQQALVNVETHHIGIKKVDTDDAIAWVNGKLSLECDDIGILMRQISRWYNVDVRYEGKPPNARLFGTINRNVNLSDVLAALGSFGINARIAGNTIVVSAR